ncbi:MAG: SusC/RagA family TonB-linked outer membrane protein [Chitinophagaceae bacterium]|nr:MAG: SusC/RagA family TonB-linked outer membrane protein [Chitinophagaceae bacterium]
MKYCLLARKQVWSGIDYIAHRYLLVLIFALCLYGRTAANPKEEPLFTLEMKQASVEKAFKEIERQSSYRVLYYTDVLKTAHAITISVKNASLHTVLNIIAEGQPFDYELKGKRIVLTPKKSGIQKQPPQVTLDTTITVSGTVRDEKTGQPLEGVTVLETGTSNGTVTNEQGVFVLSKIQNQRARLQMRYVGYQQLEIPITGRSYLNIDLSKVIANVQEVTVLSTGYQDIPRERATGSFSFIDNKLLNRRVSTNILDRIYDVTSGLNYRPNAGLRSNINIRGISTIFANDNPLIVLDGFPFDGDIQNVNPNDIENISVLKDAAAASIWGVKAGNGVIVINTKHGNYNRKTNVQFSSSLTVIQKPNLNYINSISSEDAIGFERLLFNKGFYNDFSQFGYFNGALSDVQEILFANKNGKISDSDAENKLNSLKSKDVKRDISKYLLQSAVNEQYNVNVSGGNSQINYYGSFGYDNNKSNIVGNKYQRATFRLENGYKPFEQLSVNSYISYSQISDEQNGLNYADFLPNGVNFNPIAPYTQLIGQNGESLAIPYQYRKPFVDTAQYPGLLDWHYSPLEELKNKNNTSRQYDTRIGVNVKYTILKGFFVEAKYQYQKIQATTRNIYSPKTYYTRNLINQFVYIDPSTNELTYPVALGSIHDFGMNELSSSNLRFQANFEHKWNAHHLVLLAGTESRETTNQWDFSRKYGYNPETNTFNTVVDYKTLFPLNPNFFSNLRVPNVDMLSGSVNRYVSYFINAANTFDNKYILSGSARVDGSNFFGVDANKRIVPLWSMGLAWNVSNEKFYQIRWLPFLKLRATYGYNGNTNNMASSYVQAKTENPDLNLIPVSFSTITAPPNPQLKWEKIKVLNFGLDFECRNSVLTGSIEYYRKNAVDLISQISTDPTTGVKSYIGNNASIKGQGVEITLNSRNIQAGKFEWRSSLLFNFLEDKVTAYENPSTVFDLINFGSTVNPGLANSANAIMLNRPLLSLYSYRWGGLNKMTGDPQGYLADTLATYETTVSKSEPADLVYNGRATPSIFGSFRNSFRWRDFTVSLNIVYKMGYYFRRTSINYNTLASYWGGSGDFKSRWQHPGDEATTNVPSIPTDFESSRDIMYNQSSLLVEKGDHIRLQDIRFEYSFVVNKGHHLLPNRLEAYAYINNVGIIWRKNKYKIDPEFGNTAIPNPFSISIGVTANF